MVEGSNHSTLNSGNPNLYDLYLVLGVFSPFHWLERMFFKLLKYYRGCQEWFESGFSRASPKCYKCPKKHIGPTIWFHSIKLKLFKLIFINRFNDLFLLFSEMTVVRNQNKAREEPVSWILKSFNLIEWNQIVGPVCFLGHL